jgi:hypothetical protein
MGSIGFNMEGTGKGIDLKNDAYKFLFRWDREAREGIASSRGR